MLNHLTNKEKRKLKHKEVNKTKRLSKIENEKQLYGEHYEYLKTKPFYFRDMYLNKFYTASKVYEGYKNDKEFDVFIKNSISLFNAKSYKFLDQETLNILREILIFVLDNYEINFRDDKNDYTNNYHKNIIYEGGAKIAGFIHILYGDNLKGNIYYNICLEYCQKYYYYKKQEINNLKVKDCDNEEEYWDYKYFLEGDLDNFWKGFGIEEKPGFKEGRFLDYLKAL